jgi:hypothetical protein
MPEQPNSRRRTFDLARSLLLQQIPRTRMAEFAAILEIVTTSPESDSTAILQSWLVGVQSRCTGRPG